MTTPYLIHNAWLVNEGRRFTGGLLAADGVIVRIFEGGIPSDLPSPEGLVTIDAKQQYLLPGVIDDHGHFREPGLTEKGDIHSESRAAVAGGVTSYMEMPNTKPNAITLDLLEEKFALAASKSLANYSFFLGATNTNLEEIEKADPARICGLKVFLGASTGNMLVDDPVALDAIFQKSPLLVAVHAEEESVIRRNLELFTERYGDAIPMESHPEIRSEEACLISSAKAVERALRFNTRLHLAHLSTARELGLLQNDIPLAEKRITGEVCVHHLWFDNRDYSDLGSLIKWNPAIKSPDRKSVV